MLVNPEITVTISYHRALDLFESSQEHIQFSAEWLVRQLHGWAKVGRVKISKIGSLHISARGVECVIQEEAVKVLAQRYAESPRDWQIEYPSAFSVLAPSSLTDAWSHACPTSQGCV